MHLLFRLTWNPLLKKTTTPERQKPPPQFNATCWKVNSMKVWTIGGVSHSLQRYTIDCNSIFDGTRAANGVELCGGALALRRQGGARTAWGWFCWEGLKLAVDAFLGRIKGQSGRNFPSNLWKNTFVRNQNFIAQKKLFQNSFQKTPLWPFSSEISSFSFSKKFSWFGPKNGWALSRPSA